jgi:hypothetical protein
VTTPVELLIANFVLGSATSDQVGVPVVPIADTVPTTVPMMAFSATVIELIVMRGPSTPPVDAPSRPNRTPRRPNMQVRQVFVMAAILSPGKTVR